MTGGAPFSRSAAFPVIVVLACVSFSQAVNVTDETPATDSFESYKQQFRQVLDSVFAKIPPSFMQKLQEADISPTCTIGMLKMIRGIRKFEPWALRLFDASGKYPNGILEFSKADLGAFDECLDTTVRNEFGQATSLGQYCSLKIYNTKGKAYLDKMEPIFEAMNPVMLKYKEYFSLDWVPMFRIGICILDDCTQTDLQALVDSVKPPIIDIKVANCVTREPEPWTTTQKAILISLAALAALMTASTVVDLVLAWMAPARKREGFLYRILAAFSVTSNTRGLLQMPAASSTEHTYRFLHGMRFISVCGVLVGHCVNTYSDTWSQHSNLLSVVETWTMALIAANFNNVDTFFFLSGFLMCVTLARYKNKPGIVLLAVIPLRLIRTIVPAFFVIMCIYLVPIMVTGPDLGTFMHYFYDEISEHWWQIVVQVRNFYWLDHKSVVGHYWYLSADYQAFLVSFPVFLLFRKRKSWAIATFTVMSLAACGVATWQVAGTEVPPFAVAPQKTPAVALEMVNYHYFRPYYHLVCYCSGCIVFYLSEDFNKLKPSKALQALGWCIAACCGACAVFQKLAWYRNPTPTTELGKLFTAFFDRILWSLFLSLITLACGSGRGGFVGQFLSWGLFVPLSRLSFGVYLIHLPFLEVLLSTARERLYYSMFNQFTLLFAVIVWSVLLSCVLYVACEAPTTKLSKLFFEGTIRTPRSAKSTSGATGKDPVEPVTEA